MSLYRCKIFFFSEWIDVLIVSQKQDKDQRMTSQWETLTRISQNFFIHFWNQVTDSKMQRTKRRYSDRQDHPRCSQSGNNYFRWTDLISSASTLPWFGLLLHWRRGFISAPISSSCTGCNKMQIKPKSISHKKPAPISRVWRLGLILTQWRNDARATIIALFSRYFLSFEVED